MALMATNRATKMLQCTVKKAAQCFHTTFPGNMKSLDFLGPTASYACLNKGTRRTDIQTGKARVWARN